jgi:hypothetical protein
MRIAYVLAGCLLLGSVAAQDVAAPKPQSPAKASATECMQQIQDLRQKAIDDWRAVVAEARESAKNRVEGQRVKAMPMRPDVGPVAKQASVFAKQFVGSDEAVPFLMMVVQMATDKAEQKAGIEAMLDAHIDSPELAQMGGMLKSLSRMIDEDFAKSTMQRMLKSKDADVRGWALFAMHGPSIENADRDGEEYAAAKTAVLAACEVVTDQRLAKQIRGAINLREKYGVGCDSPDIAGIDLDGVEFKLSDYKGKVIFLDFWGDW